LGAINYKNGFVTSCPQQSDRLHLYTDTQILKPSEIINSEGFKAHRKELMSGSWPIGCHLCIEAEELRRNYIIYIVPMLNIDGVVHGN
jgi:hypothetical protein